jgi:predicted transcriptional regulator
MVMGRVSRIEIEVLSSRAALKAFADTWRKAGKGQNSVPRLAFGSLRELFSAVTEKRLELIRFVATHSALNTRQLSEALGRNYKNVYNDVAALVGLGLLGKDEDGRLSAPFDEIVIHATIRDAA